MEKIEEFNREICRLKTANQSLEQQCVSLEKRLVKEKESSKEIIEKQLTSHQEKIQEILESATRKGSLTNLNDLMKKLEELRLKFDNSKESKEVERRFQARFQHLEENLEKERSKVKDLTGDRAQQRTELRRLEEQLETRRREMATLQEKVKAGEGEQMQQVRRISELEVELAHLQARLVELKDKEWCVNGCPVHFQPEIQLYREILETKGETQDKDRQVWHLDAVAWMV